LLLAIAACGAAATPRSQTADLVVIGGDVHTMDPARPHATAVAVKGDTIVAVGSDADVRPWVGEHTEVVELHGETVTPGLVDAHCHVYGLGIDLESINVRALGSEAEVADVVARGAANRPAGEWLMGRGWDQNRWPGQQFPNRATLDAKIADRPVVLRRVDGHAIWVNTAALRAAGVTKATPDPAGGRIVRDAGGEPTGVFVDNAMALVDSRMPPATPEVRERRLRNALAMLPAQGFTGVHEMGIEAETAAVYRKLAAAHQLPVHVYAFLLADPAHPPDTSPEPATGWFVMRGVKMFADGALGSRGARLYADYDDDPGNRGLWVTEPHQLAVAVEAAVAHGWQVAIHAIGDAAIGSVLDAYLAAEKAYPGDLRLRVEHTQVIASKDIPRMVEAHAIASMQPTHATSDMPWAEARVGHERIKGAYAWRTMLDKGVPVAAGSDFPVEEVNPILGIYAAVTRQDANGKPAGGWYPDQRMSLDEAIAAFTRGAAYAQFAEDRRGVIAVGRAADLTIFEIGLSPEILLAASVKRTIADGRTTFQAGPDEIHVLKAER
jgi:predicted amidohydrolase YtcJ